MLDNTLNYGRKTGPDFKRWRSISEKCNCKNMQMCFYQKIIKKQNGDAAAVPVENLRAERLAKCNQSYLMKFFSR